MSQFCRHCGAGQGPFRREGEGTCPMCSPMTHTKDKIMALAAEYYHSYGAGSNRTQRATLEATIDEVLWERDEARRKALEDAAQFSDEHGRGFHPAGEISDAAYKAACADIGNAIRALIDKEKTT